MNQQSQPQQALLFRGHSSFNCVQVTHNARRRSSLSQQPNQTTQFLKRRQLLTAPGSPFSQMAWPLRPRPNERGCSPPRPVSAATGGRCAGKKCPALAAHLSGSGVCCVCLLCVLGLGDKGIQQGPDSSNSPALQQQLSASATPLHYKSVCGPSLQFVCSALTLHFVMRDLAHHRCVVLPPADELLREILCGVCLAANLQVGIAVLSTYCNPCSRRLAAVTNGSTPQTPWRRLTLHRSHHVGHHPVAAPHRIAAD